MTPAATVPAGATTPAGQVDRPAVVLDSFAMLSYLYGEPGAGRVRKVLEQAASGERTACLSLISLGEIAYITERRNGLPAAQAALSAIQSLPLDMPAVDQTAVLTAAHIKAGHPISYADAFVVGAAVSRGATILTGDPEFRSVEGFVGWSGFPSRRGRVAGEAQPASDRGLCGLALGRSDELDLV